MDVLVNQMVFEEPLISENRKPQLRRLVHKLIEKLETNECDDFYLFKVSCFESICPLQPSGAVVKTVAPYGEELSNLSTLEKGVR